MIKKVNKSDVRLGMYIHEIRGDWMEHPFWRKSFLLDQQKDLDKLTSSGIKEIWIDTSKGLDVEADAHVPETSPSPPVESTPVKKPVIPVSLEKEMDVAKKLHGKTKEMVVSMFSDVRMGKAIEIDEATSMVDEIHQSMERNRNAMMSLVRLKSANEYTYLHSVAVCVLMIAVGKQLGLTEEELRLAGVAGLLHDIGKMAIPPEVLDKPGKLTDEEFLVMKSHPQRGWDILKSCYQVHDTALDVCLHHHERVDGKGYPEKISGDALTLFSRMGAVCDVYDAISSDRCYKKSLVSGRIDTKNGFLAGRAFRRTGVSSVCKINRYLSQQQFGQIKIQSPGSGVGTIEKKLDHTDCQSVFLDTRERLCADGNYRFDQRYG